MHADIIIEVLYLPAEHTVHAYVKSCPDTIPLVPIASPCVAVGT